MCAQSRRRAKGHTPIAGTKAKACAEAASGRELAPQPGTPRAPSAHRAGVRTDPAPGSPPRTPGGWPRRRAGRRSGGHWEPCHHSRDMQRGLGRRWGGGGSGGRGRGGRQRGRGWLWPLLHALLHAWGSPRGPGLLATTGTSALSLPNPGTQCWRAHAPRPGRDGWAAATCSQARCEEGLCGGLPDPGVRVTAQGQGP